MEEWNSFYIWKMVQEKLVLDMKSLKFFLDIQVEVRGPGVQERSLNQSINLEVINIEYKAMKLSEILRGGSINRKEVQGWSPRAPDI